MNISIKVKILILLLTLSLLGLLSACGNSTTKAALPSDKPSEPPTVSPSPDKPPDPASRVEVVYFRMPMRCTACICLEERADYVVKTYFQDELARGKLTFLICAIGDRKNVAVVNKYNGLGSQLFINTITNNIDRIKDIQEIWDWNCGGDAQGFDQKLKGLIEQSLKEVK